MLTRVTLLFQFTRTGASLLDLRRRMFRARALEAESEWWATPELVLTDDGGALAAADLSITDTVADSQASVGASVADGAAVRKVKTPSTNTFAVH